VLGVTALTLAISMEARPMKLFSAVTLGQLMALQRELRSARIGDILRECNRIFYASPADAVAELYCQASRVLKRSLSSPDSEARMSPCAACVSWSRTARSNINCFSGQAAPKRQRGAALTVGLPAMAILASAEAEQATVDFDSGYGLLVVQGSVSDFNVLVPQPNLTDEAEQLIVHIMFCDGAVLL
jgi:hypothetical protein